MPERIAMTAISILVPTYNRADLLRECLDSTLTTTVPCEVLISDNGSADDTPAVVASYDDPRLQYFRHETTMGAALLG